MNEKPEIDIFKICWDVIQTESSRHGINGTCFNPEHYKILDTIDTNFDILENRLAYTYKYGCYNALFFEKCFMKFLEDSSEFETFFSQKKLKVCSLSNGPGFDTIGFLCALCKLNKSLKFFPILNAVNLYYSWLPLYETLIYKAYEIISLKFTKFSPIVRQNINLIQGDIFLKLSKETKNCIGKSNILLMVKVFSTSKTTVNKFADSLRKIFLLLPPEALIFFIGNKKDMNNFSRRPFLNNYVKNIYGPQKITLDDIMIHASISNVVGLKPVDSGHAEFVVWQKRNPSDIEASKKDSKKNKKENKTSENIRKMSLASNENTVNEELDEVVIDNDSESELSYSSGSKLSDISSVPLTLSQSDSMNSVDNIISVLDKIELEHENYEHKIDNQNTFQHCSDSVSDLTSEFYTGNLVNKSAVNDAKSLNDANHKDCLYLIKNTSPQTVENSAPENKDNLHLKYVVPTNKKLSVPTHTQCMNDEKLEKISCVKEEKENLMQSSFKNTRQHSEIDSEITFQENISAIEQSDENLMMQEQNMAAPLAANTQKSSENVKDMASPSLHSLIQQCENLVTALAKLTISIKSDIDNSKKHSNCNKHFCQTHKNSEFSHHCCCCVRIHACCCQKMCNF